MTHRVAWVLVSIALVACTRGRERPAPSTEREPQGAPKAAEPAPTGEAEDPWLAGKLPAPSEDKPRRGGEVVVHARSEPPSLNTLLDSDWLAMVITRHRIYEPLLRVDPYDDPDYRHVPALAERWEVSDDHKVYTFHLREGVKWHDGKPFGANDIIATFDKIQDPTTKAAHVRSYLEELEEYEAIDEHTVRFTWKKPYFLTLDALADIGIQPAHVIAKMNGREYNEAASNPLNRHPVGTGPFRFVEWQANQKIVLERNNDYWGDKVHLDRLVFRIVKDATVALQLAERGELDVVDQLLPDQWVGLRDSPLRDKFHRSMYFDANYAWIGWNQDRPFFRDKRVRKALTMLVDRPGMIDKMMYGLAKPTTCHFYWASPECDPKLEPLPFDPVAAAKLLDEAGWKDSDGDGVRDRDGAAFRLKFMLPASSTTAERMATKMKEDFRRAGIDLAIQKVEWAAFSKRLRTHEFDACTLIWSGDARGDPTQIWHSKSIDGGSNYISFRNEEADRIMEQARVTFDADERNAMYRRFGAILHDEQPYTFLHVRPRLSLVSKKLRGVKESLLYWQFEDWFL